MHWENKRISMKKGLIDQIYSLLAEALFLVFADGRKETSAMGRKKLWFNRRPFRRPQSWTALFKTHEPCFVCERLRLAHFFILIPLSFNEPTV